MLTACVSACRVYCCSASTNRLEDQSASVPRVGNRVRWAQSLPLRSAADMEDCSVQDTRIDRSPFQLGVQDPGGKLPTVPQGVRFALVWGCGAGMGREA